MDEIFPSAKQRNRKKCTTFNFPMADCLLINTILRSIRNARSRNDDVTVKPTAVHISDPSTSTSVPAINGNKMPYCNGGTEPVVTHRFEHQQKTSLEDVDLSQALPEMLSDFKGQLRELEDAIRKDNEEIETLRLQNEYLRRQLAERDQIIESLQRQVRGVQ